MPLTYSNWMASTSVRTPSWFARTFSRGCSKPPVGPQWVHEIKHDGYRLIVRRDRDAVRLFTRRGHDWSDRARRLGSRADIARAALARKKLGDRNRQMIKRSLFQEGKGDRNDRSDRRNCRHDRSGPCSVFRASGNAYLL